VAAWTTGPIRLSVTADHPATYHWRYELSVVPSISSHSNYFMSHPSYVGQRTPL
jgi:hypothetical protein